VLDVSRFSVTLCKSKVRINWEIPEIQGSIIESINSDKEDDEGGRRRSRRAGRIRRATSGISAACHPSSPRSRKATATGTATLRRLSMNRRAASDRAATVRWPDLADRQPRAAAPNDQWEIFSYHHMRLAPDLAGVRQ